MGALSESYGFRFCFACATALASKWWQTLICVLHGSIYLGCNKHDGNLI